uniref:Uncharacterized protein n=1 Tax=Arundo donax TaxID=35708 RepID=A0A0A9ADT3_ARUDO
MVGLFLIFFGDRFVRAPIRALTVLLIA